MNLATPVRNWWMMAIPGALAIGFGLALLLWPFVPRRFLYVLAGWGLITGALQSSPRSVCRARGPGTGCWGLPATRHYFSLA